MPEQIGSTDTWWYSAEEDARERRCVNHRACACPHTDCRDGWLDAEEPAPVPGKPNRTVVVRCPHCFDAALMAAELTKPKTGGRSWRP